LQLDEGAKLLQTITPSGLPPQMQSEVLTLRGTAYAMSGNLNSASQSFAEARALDPASAAPLIAEAPLLLRAGERERAKVLATKATELAPQNVTGWYGLGTILHTTGDSAGAIKAFDRALALNAKHVDARVSRAAALIGLSRDKEAEQELTQLKAWEVIEPRASYLRGAVAARKGDLAAAKAEFSESVNLIDAMPPALRLGSEPLLMAGAMAHRGLGNNEKAREYLEALLGRNSRHYAAQLMLASMLVDNKQYPRAVTMLESLQRIAPKDPQILSLLGSVHLARRQYAQAADLFERAATINPTGDATRELGFSQLGLGLDKLGIANLEKTFARDKTDLRSGVQLATVYAQQGQGAKALQIAESIVKNDPANLAMLNFLGNVKGRLRDMRGAREAFTQVLAKDPDFRPALINLSWLDIEQGRFDEARVRLKQALGTRPDDPDLLYQLGTLEQRANRPQEALAHWQHSDEKQRGDARHALAIVDLHLSQRQAALALTAAKAALAKYPDHLNAHIAVGRAYFANGEVQPARAALQEATRIAGFNPDQQVLLGRLQLGIGNTDGAAYNVTKALQARADDLGAMVLQVEVEARRGSAAGIDTALKALSTKHPSAVPTLITAASVALSRGQIAAAVAGLRTAMGKAPRSSTALMLAHAHLTANETAKALAVLEDWAKKQPDDALALKALAEVQVFAGNTAAARKSYTQILATSPNDPATLAGYAGLLQTLGDSAAAGMAEKALKLAPNNPEYTALLGWILVLQGQTESGLKHLREARLRDPNNGQTRFHLAYALNKAGRATEAKDELRAALAPPSRLPPSPELVRLKTELGL
jgi:putative PEP-CTERM system TPR-repeat lipoprotein